MDYEVNIYEQVAKNIKKYRQLSGMTQAQLAEAIGVSHEFIRRIILKGVSLNCYTQEDISLVCSHINSLFRKELNGMCPFDLVEKYIPTNILHTLGFKKINSSDVNLTPHLLGDKNIKNILKYLTKDMIKKANIQI